MTLQTLSLPGIGLVVALLVMGLAWLRQRRTGNAGIVDPLWSASIGVLALAYAALAEGWGPRRLLVAAIAGFWSVRLTLHLAHRVASEDEDGRYAALRRELGEGFDRWLLVFYLAQGVLAVLLSWAMLVPAAAVEAGWRIWDLAAVVMAVVALGGEWVADRQLARWRALPEAAGRTCRSGLWRYSRHPNYFFEWLHWLAYPLLAVGLPLGWSVWAVPALMLLLVLKVTGIPPTEARAVERRGDDYRAYQRTTSAFFPLPPRTAPAESASPTADPTRP
jgi:steroid 5-alpha reductase family enzyme